MEGYVYGLYIMTLKLKYPVEKLLISGSGQVFSEMVISRHMMSEFFRAQQYIDNLKWDRW